MNNNIKLSSKGFYLKSKTPVIIGSLVLGLIIQFFENNSSFFIFLPLILYLIILISLENIISIEYLINKKEIEITSFYLLKFKTQKKTIKLNKIDFKKSAIRFKAMTDTLYINDIDITFSQFFGIDREDLEKFYINVKNEIDEQSKKHSLH